ncbi:hypothetical protein V6N12_028700 [Hibiscus sabdariffa]|uniref:Uncharacterized protein n=1 Tax=Hibiscus sabdariffa TaxID=183260 RepID=A0ABR2F6K3_9ROSI
MQKIKLFQILLHCQGCRRSNSSDLASSSGMQKIKLFRCCFIVRDEEDQTFQILLHRQGCERSNLACLASSSGMQKIKPFRYCFTVRGAEDQTFQILLHQQRCRRSNSFGSCFIVRDAEDQTLSDLASPSRVRKIKLFILCLTIRDTKDHKHLQILIFPTKDEVDELVRSHLVIREVVDQSMNSISPEDGRMDHSKSNKSWIKQHKLASSSQKKGRTDGSTEVYLSQRSRVADRSVSSIPLKEEDKKVNRRGKKGVRMTSSTEPYKIVLFLSLLYCRYMTRVVKRQNKIL